jgi:hypothetical protein
MIKVLDIVFLSCPSWTKPPQVLPKDVIFGANRSSRGSKEFAICRLVQQTAASRLGAPCLIACGSPSFSVPPKFGWSAAALIATVLKQRLTTPDLQ